MLSAFKDTFKGLLAFGVSSSLVSAVGFVLIPLYTRYLSVEEFGLLGLLNLTNSISATIFGLGLNSAIFRSYFDYDDETSQKRLIGTALLVALMGSIGLVVFSTIGAEQLIARKIFGLPNTGYYFRVTLYFAAVGLLNAIPLAVYRAERRFSRFAIFNAISALLQMLLIIVLVISFRLGLGGIVMGQLIGALTVNILLLYSIRDKIEITLLHGEVHKLLAYGLPLVPGGVFYILLNSGSLYFLQSTRGLNEVGIFNLALRIASFFSIFVISPFQLIWPPMMFSVEKTGYAEKFYARMLTYALYASVGLGLVLSIFAHEIVTLVSTAVYQPATQFVWLLLFGHILFVVQNVFNVGIILKRKTIYWSIALVVETVVCMLLWLVLSPHWGMQGIAIGSIIGHAIGASVTLMFSRRFLKVQYEWGRALFLLALFPLSVKLGQTIPTTLGVFSIILKGLLVLASLGAPFLLRLWHPDEMTALRQFWQQAVARFSRKDTLCTTERSKGI